METLYRLPFAVLECPNIKLKRPSWVHMPSAMTVYALVVVSYFLITGGEAWPVGAGSPGEQSRCPAADRPSRTALVQAVVGVRCCGPRVTVALLPAGIIYDVIVEPPSVGSMTDEHGHQRPVAFLAYRWERGCQRTCLSVRAVRPLCSCGLPLRGWLCSMAALGVQVFKKKNNPKKH